MSNRSNFRMVDDRLLIELDVPEEKSRGGIVLPNSDRQSILRGKVVRSGPGRYILGNFIPTDINVGQTVLFARSHSVEVDIDGDKFHVVSLSDLLVILD